jgi:hypothetical protein
MIDPLAIDMLRALVPASGFVDRIVELDSVAASLPFDVFREPVAVIDIDDSGNNHLMNLNAEYLTGWSHHMAYSMRVRMRSLEPVIVDELAGGRALAPQVLLRSHLEAAAMAALCVETLKNGNHEALSKLVPQTLFGTALFAKAKRDERIAEMLTYSEQRTITISQAMSALHRFMYPDGRADHVSSVYSLLSEASHPNHRGTKLFVRAEEVDSSGEYGWQITYSGTESVPTELTEKFVETLVFSMSAGYAATELLRNMQLTDTDDGPEVHGVPEEIGNRIWFDILQKSVPKDPKGGAV